MSGSTSGGGDGAPAEPPGLRRLRHLVTALTVTLILGVITVVALLVIRLAAFSPPTPPLLPPAVSLPEGEQAGAVTFGAGWVAVVSADAAGRERIRVFDATDGTPRGELLVGP
jgi:hypothetical protein